MKKTDGMDVLNYILLCIVLVLCLYPFYYVFIYSISDPQKAIGGVYLFPKGFTLATYSNVFRLDNLFHSLFISVLRTVTGTVLTLFCCAMFAFLLSRKEMRFRIVIYRFVVATMYLNAGLIATYLTYAALELKDNFLVYILPTAISGFYIVLIKTFMEQLPSAVEEAATIDGAGYLTLFFKIVLPMSMPVLATIAIFSAVTQWNTWVDTLMYISDKRLYTAQYVLYNFLNRADAIAEAIRTSGRVDGAPAQAMTPQAIKMTITMVITLPILFVYPFFQRFFVKGLLLGAVKG